MQIDALKPTTRFLNGAKLKCLAGKLHSTGFDGMKSGVLAINVPKSGSKVLLVGGDGVRPSTWHREELDRLTEDMADVRPLRAALLEYVATILTPAERRHRGSEPAVGLTLEAIVLDDVRKLAFLVFSSTETHIDNHGLVAVRENGGWRLEEGDFVGRYAGEVGLTDAEGSAPPAVGLVGTWTLDEGATADLLRRQGESEDFIRLSMKNLRGTEWLVTEAGIVQKHPRYCHEYQLVAVEWKRGLCQITVSAPGLATPEVWKVRITNDQMVGAGCVLKRQQTDPN